MPAQTSPQPADRIITEYTLTGEGLNDAIGRFTSAAKADPLTSWLLLPTDRLVRNVTDSLTAQSIPFSPSRICTLEGFCRVMLEEHRTHERFLTKAESRLLLAKVLEDHAAKVPLFSGSGRTSSRTIDDLMTFKNVIIARKVPFPECLLDLESAKSDQIGTILEEYRHALDRLDLLDSDTILEWTIDHINRAETSPLGFVIIYGFHASLPLEDDLFEAIRDRAANVFFTIPDGTDQKIFRHRAGNSIPSMQASSAPAQITGLFAEKGPLGTGDLIRTRTFPSRYAEIYGIAAEIVRLNAEGVPLSDIAVILPDLREDLGLIGEVFYEFGLPWNAAVGQKLAREPVVRFLCDVAGLISVGRTREEMIRVIGSPYFRARAAAGASFSLDAAAVDLVSRYAKIDGPRPDWEKKISWLVSALQDEKRTENFPGITTSTAERVRNGIRLLTRDLDALAKKQGIRNHVEGYRSFLDRWGIPDTAPAPDDETRSREMRLCLRFFSLLDTLPGIAWIPAGEPVDPHEFARLVRAFAEEQDRDGRQDDGGVSLLGLRDCLHLKFPLVFIGGLVENSFPRLTTRLPFTNSMENARMGTRTLPEILCDEQYYFIAALLSGQKTVCLSAALADGEKPLLTSAFFERVRERIGNCPWPEPGDTDGLSSRHTAAIRAGRSIGEGNICASLAMIPSSLEIDDIVSRINIEQFHRMGGCDSPYDGILSGDRSICDMLAARYGPDHVYSATSLETYAACPFAYFLNRLVGLLPHPEVEPNLSAGDRGTAIHDVLSSFYRRWQAAGHEKVSPALLPEARDLILVIARESLDRYSFESPLWHATRILMLGDPHTGPGYFERFLLHEADEEDSPLVPSRFEFAFGMKVRESDDPASSPDPVELSDGERKIRIRGRIDRIDITPDGSFVIYDYKSGLQHPRAKDIEAGTALQLPLYLRAFESITGNRGVGGGYYTIRREVGRSIVMADPAVREMMAARPRASADFAGLIRQSQGSTFDYIDGIRAGKFPLPCEERCPNPYCEFVRICRFDPYRVFQCREES